MGWNLSTGFQACPSVYCPQGLSDSAVYAQRPAARFMEDTWVCCGVCMYVHNQSILKEISPGISLEGMMLKLKLQHFGHLMRRVDLLEKTDAGRDWGQEEKGTTEDEMGGWHH